MSVRWVKILDSRNNLEAGKGGILGNHDRKIKFYLCQRQVGNVVQGVEAHETACATSSNRRMTVTCFSTTSFIRFPPASKKQNACGPSCCLSGMFPDSCCPMGVVKSRVRV